MLEVPRHLKLWELNCFKWDRSGKTHLKSQSWGFSACPSSCAPSCAVLEAGFAKYMRKRSEHCILFSDHVVAIFAQGAIPSSAWMNLDLCPTCSLSSSSLSWGHAHFPLCDIKYSGFPAHHAGLFWISFQSIYISPRISIRNAAALRGAGQVPQYLQSQWLAPYLHTHFSSLSCPNSELFNSKVAAALLLFFSEISFLISGEKSSSSLKDL